MLKLMKYEFRKLRTTLLVLVLAMLALELGFVVGNALGKEALRAVCLALLSLLAFGAYAYILISGVVSYSRELRDRSGYLVFMTPTRPISIVLSKLLCTLLAGVVLTVALGLVAWMDYAWLTRSLKIDATLVDQINTFMRFTLGDISFNLRSIGQALVFTVLSVLIEIMLSMCTAYLAITVSATVLQNRKGFLRALVSVVLFLLITWGASWLTDKVIEIAPRFLGTGAIGSSGMDINALTALLGVSLALHLALGAVFAVVSASLLKRKVSL